MTAFQTTEQLSHQILLGYAKLKNNCYDEVKQLLETSKKLLSEPYVSMIDQASWLWLYGEYVQKSKDKSQLLENEQLIMLIIKYINKKWDKPDVHWLKSTHTDKDVYLSQTAFYYAALRSASFIRVDDLALMTMKQMRDYLFANFMDGISMVHKKGGHEASTDMVLATVPFGYFTPGDLALMKALEQIDEDRLVGEEAAWFSWYYSEVGNLVKARLLLQQAEQTLAPDNIWLQCATIILSVHEYEDDIVFDHLPKGYESPYFEDVNERYPRIPLVGEEVTIQVISRGKINVVQMQLHYQIDNGTTETVDMQKVESINTEPYYVGKIRAIDSLSTVNYSFIAISDTNTQYTSKSYSYHTLKWTSLSFIGSTTAGSDEMLYFEAEQNNFFAKVKKNLGEQQSQQFTFTPIKEAELISVRSELKSITINHLPRLFVLMDNQSSVAKLKLCFSIDENTQWYGMGERFAKLNYQNCELDNYVFNQYKDQGLRTYIPVPLAIGTEGLGIFVRSGLYSQFRFGSQNKQQLEIEADVLPRAEALEWNVLNGSPKNQLNQFSHVVGKPKLPPKWAFGPWMSSNNWDSEKETLYQLEQNKKYEIPATVIVLEQWSDEATFYIFNDAQYESKSGEARFTYDDFTFPAWGRWPNPKQLVDRIHEDGLKLLLWQAPVMKYMEGVTHTQRDADADYMINKGYGVKDEQGQPYAIPSFEWFRGSYVPDFTNPNAAKWWFEKRQYLLDELGIDGFKTDGGECIYGSELQFYDGRKGAQMRNEYPNTYIGAFHQFANAHVEGGAITFSRAGYTGAQLIPIHWAGDERSTFEAFQASIRAGLSAGLSGIPFWGWDFGGFSGEIPTAELYIRGTQMATFCPVMQYHAESKGQFNLDRTPWNIAERTGDETVLKVYKYFADLRMNLLPYIYDEAKKCTETGEPLMRAHVLDYANDEEAVKQELQYMFGQSLLVIPVTTEGATSVRGYLPEGKWLNLFDTNAQAIEGKRYVDLEAKLDSIPIFIKENSIVSTHVNETLKLGSHVGNEWKEAENMLFVGYVTSETAFTYLDEQTTLELNIVCEEDKWSINYNLKGSAKAFLSLRQAQMFKRLVHVNSNNALTEVTDEQQLKPGRYMYRHSELLIALEQGQHSFVGE